MTDTLKKEFHDRLDDINAGMLAAEGARSVPMSHYVDEDGATLWFITAKGTDLAKAAQTGAEAEYILSSGGEHLYARVEGMLSAVTNPAKLDEIWNAIAASWFEDGKQDDDIQLMRLDMSEAEVWATRGNAGFLFQIAKAHLTDAKPDMGEHGTLRF